MRYPVMDAPPVLDGALHDRLMVVCPDAVAVSDLGALGAVADADADIVVALSTLDAAVLSPTELLA